MSPQAVSSELSGLVQEKAIAKAFPASRVLKKGTVQQGEARGQVQWLDNAYVGKLWLNPSITMWLDFHLLIGQV